MPSATISKGSSSNPSPNPLLCSIREAETWQLENPYLLSHYRTPNPSYLHNQTLNIYTHALGFASFLALAAQTYNDILPRYPTADWLDFLHFGTFFACALVCFGCSALFHMFMSHSPEVNQAWLLADLYGVFALIAGTVFSGTFYAFYCETVWWVVYSVGIVSLVVPYAVLCTRPQYRSTRWRSARAGLVFARYACYVVPMIHINQRWGRAKANEMVYWNLWFAEGVVYELGAFFYVFRIPERWMPGTFDIWGASHQISHVAMLVGATLHYQSLLRGFDYNHDPASRQC